MKRLGRFAGLCAVSLFVSLVWLTPSIFSQGIPTAAPEEVGLSPERLGRIRPWMKSYVDQQKLAGLITVVARRGKVVHMERVGMRDKEAAKPMEFDTIFRIYSMSKPITSVAVMMLYEEGRFQLDDPVSKFIPDFKDLKVYTYSSRSTLQVTDASREITIRDLLIHTSGLTYGFSHDPVDVMYREARVLSRNGTLKDMIRKLAKLPLRHHPGQRWEYSVSIDVLGYLVEVFSGMPFDRFLEEKIFKPLNMKDTGFHVPKEKFERFATNYGPDDDGLKVIDAPATSRFSKPTNFFSGGGGLVSTASDYMRFAQMMLNGGELDGVRLLSPKTLELMTKNHIPEKSLPLRLGPEEFKGYGFGLGFAVLMDVVKSGVVGSKGEFRWSGAASTHFWIDPEEELIGLLLTQFMPSGRYPIRTEFKVLTYQAIIDQRGD